MATLLGMIGSRQRISRALLVPFLLVWALGCATQEATKESPLFWKWKAKTEEARAVSPSQKERCIDLLDVAQRDADAVSPSKPEAASERPLPTQRVTLKMHKTDVAVLLRALARLADQNIMINDQVTGKINVNAKEAPWDQVFRGILRTQGLVYRWEGDIIRIMTVKDMEHELKLEAIQEKRKVQELELKRVEPLLTKVIPIDYADSAKLKDNLQAFLTRDGEGKPRGSVMVDEHSNALIVQASQHDLLRMVPLIQELDKPTPQILIEANIVETTRETARELGIQWGGLYKNGNYWITPGANVGGVMGEKLSPTIDPTSGMAANFPAAFPSTEGLTVGIVKHKAGKYILNIQLSALQDEGRLNILSSPSITTVDNQKAIIESGAEIPFQTITGTGSNQTVEIEWKTASLKLEVTPHVIDHKLLKLKIDTSKDEVDFTNTVQGNPTIVTKKAETNVMLLDGQTTVIGGLTKETNTNSDTGVPLLMDIPLFGYLFKSQGLGNEMEEVLIFITPHILKEAGPDKALASQGQAGEKPASTKE